MIYRNSNGVFTPEQDNDKTNVEPVHSYDAFHTRFVGHGVKGFIGMHRFDICLVVVVLLWCENTITLHSTMHPMLSDTMAVIHNSLHHMTLEMKKTEPSGHRHKQKKCCFPCSPRHAIHAPLNPYKYVQSSIISRYLQSFSLISYHDLAVSSRAICLAYWALTFPTSRIQNQT